MLVRSWEIRGLTLALTALLALSGCGDDGGGNEEDAGTDSSMTPVDSGNPPDVTACTTNPCMNGGACFSMGVEAYLCMCTGGFSGNNCETAPPQAVNGFGTNGLSSYSSGIGNDRGRAVIALPNNEAFVVGSSEPVLMNIDAMAMRVSASGQPNPAFDTDGVYVNDLGTVDDAFFAADLSDDNTLVAAVGYSGAAGSRNANLLVYNLTTGAVSSAVRPLHATLDDRLHAVTIAVVGGTTYIYGAGYRHVDAMNTEYVVARFTAAGALDTTFNGDGILSYDLSAARTITGTTAEQAKGIVVLANGDIIIAGEADQTGDTDIALVKITAPGTDEGAADLDETFGTDGVAIVSFGPGSGTTRDNLYSMSTDAAGNFVLFGSRAGVNFGTPACMPTPCVTNPGTPTTTRNRIVARVLADGSGFDTTFKNFDAQPSTGIYQFPGVVPFTLGAISLDSRIGSVQADGKILSAGYANFPTGVGTQSENAIVLFRLNANGTIDTTFGVAGASVVNPMSAPYPTRWGMAEAYGAAQRTDGSYVTTGYGRLAGQVSADKVRVVNFRFSTTGLLYTTSGF